MKKLPTILPELLPSMGATPEDSVIVEYHSGFAEATVKKNDGRVLTQRVYSKGGFQSFTAYNPDEMEREDLIRLVHQMKTKDRLTQSEIARRLGISQSTVSNYLRK
ncbi:winged helix-turn-helix transcriptional regulator [Bilophila wadsworthia]|uniref:winged helix-turn-helix transcriptional regulator n=1 Tax=Bilophila wadsworthia TaxID=35833 RepID=UPI0034CFB74C